MIYKLSNFHFTGWARRLAQRALRALLISAVVAGAAGRADASDHADTPLLQSINRPQARITDFYAFTRGDQLVLALCLDPSVPSTATHYTFASDLTVRFHLDRHSAVQFDDPAENARFGGTIVRPGRVSADVVFEITFDDHGEPQLAVDGRFQPPAQAVRLFAGLRDDPFIRAPRAGRNVAAVVLEIPLAHVLGRHSTLLAWATTKVPDIRGPICEHAGLPLRSMFPENDAMNTLHPRDHFRLLGLRPDVLILDAARPISYPNGRALADDVMDIVNDPRVMINDAPYPTANDVPFLAAFPYLAPPQP